MTFKIDRVFEKNKQHFESKTGKKGSEFSYQKGPQQRQNFLHEERVTFFVRLYLYILLTTSVW